MYRRARHRAIRLIRACMFELGAAQIALGVWWYLQGRGTDEPPIILLMSAGALWFSGITTCAVAAVDEGNDQ